MDDNKILKGIATTVVGVVGLAGGLAFGLLADGLSVSNRNRNRNRYSNNPPSELKLEMFELAHQYYTSGDYKSSMHLVDSCLKIAPQWSPAIGLKKSILKDSINNEDGIGIGAAVVITVGVGAAKLLFYIFPRK